VAGIEILAVPTAHNGSRRHPWRSRKLAVGYLLRGPGETLYYPGDTAFDADFDAIRQDFQPTLAILPIGCFAPRIPLKIHHLSPEEAAEAGRILQVRSVIPCHFGTFALTLDRPSTALPRFARAARARGVAWQMPALLTPEDAATP
jgi:N-acyl-phosphatidylethanolamine-hydrolysing phospholipase D